MWWTVVDRIDTLETRSMQEESNVISLQTCVGHNAKVERRLGAAVDENREYIKRADAAVDENREYIKHLHTKAEALHEERQARDGSVPLKGGWGSDLECA